MYVLHKKNNNNNQSNLKAHIDAATRETDTVICIFYL